MPGVGVKIFETLLQPIQRLPLGFHYAWGRVFSFVARNVLHYRRDEVLINLSRSFPDKKYSELKDISKAFYDHLGEIFAETLWFGGCKGRPDKYRSSGMATLVNAKAFSDSFKASRGVMILDSHFGNWELLGGMLAAEYDDIPREDFSVVQDDVVVVYKHLSSKFWDQFIADNRCAVLDNFQGYVESSQVLRYAIKNRTAKKAYLFPIDQFPYKGAVKHSIPSFMHQKTEVMAGGAALASKLGLAVWYLGVNRREKGKYDFVFKPICEDASGMDPVAIMESFYSLLEEDINNNPMNYLWSHKRWK